MEFSGGRFVTLVNDFYAATDVDGAAVTLAEEILPSMNTPDRDISNGSPPGEEPPRSNVTTGGGDQPITTCMQAFEAEILSESERKSSATFIDFFRGKTSFSYISFLPSQQFVFLQTYRKDLVPTYNLSAAGERRNLFVYVWLGVEGGIYIRSDQVPTAKFADLLDECTSTIFDLKVSLDGNRLAIDRLLASIPNHRFWWEVLAHIVENPLHSSGEALTYALDKTPNVGMLSEAKVNAGLQKHNGSTGLGSLFDAMCSTQPDWWWIIIVAIWTLVIIFMMIWLVVAFSPKVSKSL